LTLATRAINLTYHSAERFHKDYKQLRKGYLFLPAKKILPKRTILSLHITVPGVEQVFVAKGTVISANDPQTAKRAKKPSGMLVAILGGPDTIIGAFNSALSSNALYRNMLGDPGDADLSIEWLKKAIHQQEITRDKEAEPEIIVPPTSEKKDLTLSEREKIKPVAEFLMDLTKAMLRSGYYSADHPGCKDAKRGLYDAFQNCLGDSSEIMITNRETRELTEILITGILDEPVNVRTLVGTGMAELFVPKLREYFNRKGLVSFAIKKRITAGHFESFVDIMSDPRVDRGQNSKIGELLSNALIEHGITEISTVFMDDMIALELNLPWRVEMAIQRLAKDLKVLPMFKTESDDAIREMKLQIIQDIIRPLRHPEFLKEFITNCYIIAKHVKTIEAEDFKQVIIEAFPLETLLPTSRFIFDELIRLRDMIAETPQNPALLERFDEVKRVLKWMARRLALTEVRGAMRFLEQLYTDGVLTFEELPPNVQYLVNTTKMVKDVQAHTQSYVYRLVNVSTAESAAILLKCFRRIVPVLIEQDDWKVIYTITKAASKAGTKNKLFSENSALPLKPQKFIFKDLTDDLIEGYIGAHESQRQLIGKIAGKLGSQGIDVLTKVLSECKDREARMDAVDLLIKKGDRARYWVLNVLDDPKQPWYLHRNALLILRYIGKEEGDIERACKFFKNSDPRIRDEALFALVTLKAADAEQLVIAALNDEDDKVRWRATSALGDLSPLKDASVEHILNIIKTELPEETEEVEKHIRKVSQLITSLGVLKGLRNLAVVEDTLLDIAHKASEQKKGIFQRLKKTSDTNQTTILSAAITTLGKIGTPKSEAFLAKLAGSNTPHAEPAQEAVENIRLRYASQEANTPASV
jgi:HEAT repeat protein